MQIIVTGSIATDHLMHFPGQFTDSLLPDQLDRVSLSFLVDDLTIRRGGVAGNISFGLARLGLSPVLLDAVGADFADYRSWLTRHGVNCDYVRQFDDVQTARFVCTTDDAMNQIGSFYAGAMARAREIELQPVVDAIGGTDLVMISAGDPAAMRRHAAECRQRGYTFAADPSQQLARMDGPAVRDLIEGAELLFTNDYEYGLLKAKTELSDANVLELVSYRITTHGPGGVEVYGADGTYLKVPVLPEVCRVEPTGVGDAFRSGFLAARARGLAMTHCAQLGSLIATLVLETEGTQEYVLETTVGAKRLAQAYGEQDATAIAAAMGWNEQTR